MLGEQGPWHFHFDPLDSAGPEKKTGVDTPVASRSDELSGDPDGFAGQLKSRHPSGKETDDFVVFLRGMEGCEGWCRSPKHV